MQPNISSLRGKKLAKLAIFAIVFLGMFANSFVIWRLQEDQKDFSVSYGQVYSIAAFDASFVSSQEFSASTWVKPAPWTSSWIDVLRVNLTAKSYPLFQSSGSKSIFYPGSTGGGTSGWNFVPTNVDTDIPAGQWTFLALGLDNNANIQYGFIYRFTDINNQILNFRQRATSGTCWNLFANGTMVVGSWGNAVGFGGSLQNVRLFPDYVPKTSNEMYNLACMGPYDSALYVFHFASDPSINANSTIPVEFIDPAPSTLTNLTAKKEVSPGNSIPILGPYNTLECRANTFLSFTNTNYIDNGVVIAMDLRLLANGPNIQTLFSLRNPQNNYVPLSAEISNSSGSPVINIWLSAANGSNVTIVSSANLDPVGWNRVIFEAIQAQSLNISTGFFSTRIWVNGSQPVNRSYFGNYSSSPFLFLDNEAANLDLCSQMVSETSQLETGKDGSYDILNFLWFNGTQSLFTNSSDSSCRVTGFLDSHQYSCLQCASGYYYYNQTCISQCPANTILHNGTNSCQECYYGKYMNDTGYCVTTCNPTGQYLLTSRCHNCDPSCLNCSGGGPSACTACSNGSYLDSSASTCITCYTSCLTCNSSGNQSCLSCSSGTYLYNNQCVQSCPSTLYLNYTTNTCNICPQYQVNFTISAQSSIYVCQDFATQISYAQMLSNVSWAVTTSPRNTTHENQLMAYLGNVSSFTIPKMTLLPGTSYNFTATLKSPCLQSPATVIAALYVVSYSTSVLSSTHSTFLTWWNDTGILLGCTACQSTALTNSSASSPSPPSSCSACSSGMLYSNGMCTCAKNQYADLTQVSSPTCLPKIPVQMNWWNSNTTTQTNYQSQNAGYQLVLNFSNSDFIQTSSIMSYVASIISLGPQQGSPTFNINNFTAYVDNSSQQIALNFSITQSLEAGSALTTQNLSQFNNLIFSPFMLANPSLQYGLSAQIYLSGQTLATIQSLGSATVLGAKVQSVLTTIIPILLGSAGTVAILLIGFTDDIDIFRYMNVDFPENVMEFYRKFDQINMLPNLFQLMRPNSDVSYSTIGKFAEWNASTSLLEARGDNLSREVIALALIAVFTFFAVVIPRTFRLNLLVNKALALLRWNTFLSYFLGDFAGFLLFSLVEFREGSLSNPYLIGSFAVAVTVVVGYTGWIVYFIYILNRKGKPLSEKRTRFSVQESQLPARKHKDPKVQVPKSVKIISEGFSYQSPFHGNFTLVMMLEKMMIVLLAFSLQNSPVIQISLYLLISMVFPALVVSFGSPFESKLDTLIFLVNHACRALLGALALAIGLNSSRGLMQLQALTDVGNFMIFLIMATLAFDGLTGIGVVVFFSYKKLRAVCKKGQKNNKLTLRRIQLQSHGGKSSFQESSKEESRINDQ